MSIHSFRWSLGFDDLIVGFPLDPAARVVAKNPLPNFIEDEDEQGEWDSREPPINFERVHF